MNIYDALRKDHKKVESLLDQLVGFSESSNDQWRTVVDQICDELVPHARAEEAVFYNALREMDQSKSLIAHSYAEHAMAETELRTLQAMKAIDVNWTTLAKKLRTDLLHHVEEEQGKVFSAAQEVFSAEEAEQIGNAFEQLKPTILNQSFTGQTMDMIANLLPRRVVESFRKGFSQEKRSA